MPFEDSFPKFIQALRDLCDDPENEVDSVDVYYLETPDRNTPVFIEKALVTSALASGSAMPANGRPARSDNVSVIAGFRKLNDRLEEMGLEKFTARVFPQIIPMKAGTFGIMTSIFDFGPNRWLILLFVSHTAEGEEKFGAVTNIAQKKIQKALREDGLSEI